MLGVAIGVGLILLGLLFANFYVVAAGFVAALAFAFFNREPSIVYVKQPEAVPTEARPKHTVLQSQAPDVDSGPMPWEVGLPMPQGLMQLGFQGSFGKHGFQGRPPDPFSAFRTPADPKDAAGWGQKYGMSVADFLPFGNYGSTTPMEWVLAGFPINIGKIAMRRQREKYLSYRP